MLASGLFGAVLVVRPVECAKQLWAASNCPGTGQCRFKRFQAALDLLNRVQALFSGCKRSRK
eukprot:11440699-Alexandrium_andersonii.AAC.1